MNNRTPIKENVRRRGSKIVSCHMITAPLNHYVKGVKKLFKVVGTYTVSGGPLKNTFKLQQFHFHFGCHNRVGSEHTEWEQSFPGEVSPTVIFNI